MKPLIKLCGLMRLEDVLAANRAAPDMVGFVFAKESRRAVSASKAAEMRAALAAGIQPVGVFTDAPLSEILALVRAGTIELVQLHGSDSHEQAESCVAALHAHGVKVIRAIRVSRAADLRAAERSSADLLLLDSARPGHGEPFDHALLRNFPRAYLLAGGLTPESVGLAVRALRPFGVDVSSGIETHGSKDADKMLAFTRNATEAASVERASMISNSLTN